MAGAPLFTLKSLFVYTFSQRPILKQVFLNYRTIVGPNYQVHLPLFLTKNAICGILVLACRLYQSNSCFTEWMCKYPIHLQTIQFYARRARTGHVQKIPSTIKHEVFPVQMELELDKMFTEGLYTRQTKRWLPATQPFYQPSLFYCNHVQTFWLLLVSFHTSSPACPWNWFDLSKLSNDLEPRSADIHDSC